MSNPKPEVWERFIAGDGKPGMRTRPASVGERLGWQRCETCNGRGQHPGHYIEKPCPDCVVGWTPPAELVARMVQAHAEAEGFISPLDDGHDSMRAALLEQARWIGEQ